MTGSIISTDFIRRHRAQTALTVLGFSGVVLIFLPFVNYYIDSRVFSDVPVDTFIEFFERLDEPFLLTSLGTCVVLPFFISAGYLRWLFTEELSRWEGGLGYTVALIVLVLSLLLIVPFLWREGLVFDLIVGGLLALGLGVAVGFVIQNLRNRAQPRSMALVAMQLAYLPFALGWLALGLPVLTESSSSRIGTGAYLALLTVLVYTMQVGLSVRGQPNLLLRLLPLGLIWATWVAIGLWAWFGA